jgi:7-carboxy-7-deazaguanine synthase
VQTLRHSLSSPRARAARTSRRRALDFWAGDQGRRKDDNLRLLAMTDCIGHFGATSIPLRPSGCRHNADPQLAGLAAPSLGSRSSLLSYVVKEVFYSLQGEGARIGSPSVFIRFAGCNLWSGREADRAKAICQFCDTDFVGGERYTADQLARYAMSLWPAAEGNKWIVLTGGEPALQIDATLLRALKAHGFRLAIETNGSLPLAGLELDWVCVSPKAGAPLMQFVAEEVKLVFPQPGLMPDALPPVRALHRWLSPMDGPKIQENTRAAVEYSLAHPEWRVAIQAHKLWGIR